MTHNGLSLLSCLFPRHGFACSGSCFDTVSERPPWRRAPALQRYGPLASQTGLAQTYGQACLVWRVSALPSLAFDLRPAASELRCWRSPRPCLGQASRSHSITKVKEHFLHQLAEFLGSGSRGKLTGEK